MRLATTLFFILLFSLTSAARQDQESRDSLRQERLPEVVVSAERRELRPIELPTALTVVTEGGLVGENSPDLRSLSGIVPNFYMQEGGLKLSTPIYVRGVGSVSGLPPVGMYVDGLPVFDKNAFVFELYDIRQIEVLRGPQTTLYGRNCLNGLIHISTNPPAAGFSLRLKAGFSSFDTRSCQLVTDLPWKNVYNRLAFSWKKSRGYFRNLQDGGRKSNPSDSYNLRYRGLCFKGEGWKIAWGASYDNAFDGGYAYHILDSLKARPREVDYNTPSSYDRELFSAHTNLERKGEKAVFSSVTSYAWTRDKQVLDADFSRMDVYSNRKKSHQNLFTQELNLRSAAGGPLSWTAGFFAFHKRLTNRYLATFGADRKLLIPLDIDRARYFNRTTAWGLAGYGQISLEGLWEGMTLTAGLRYDFEKAGLDYRDSLFFSGSDRFKPFHDDRQHRESKAFLPKFSLLQQWNGSLSLYLSIAKGYKAGGYNIISNDMSSQMVKLEYGRESLWNYEAGLKYASPGGDLDLNAAVFFTDWKDQQIFTMGLMGPGIKNAGDARAAGAEADLRWKFLPAFSFVLSCGYVHSGYYRNGNPEHVHNRIVMAPEFTCNTGLHFRKRFKGRLFDLFTLSTNVNGFGRQYFDEANTLEQEPYFLWNAEAGLSGRKLYLRIWARNLLDSRYFTYMLNNPIGGSLPQYHDMGQSGTPARCGLSLEYSLMR